MIQYNTCLGFSQQFYETIKIIYQPLSKLSAKFGYCVRINLAYFLMVGYSNKSTTEISSKLNSACRIACYDKALMELPPISKKLSSNSILETWSIFCQAKNMTLSNFDIFTCFLFFLSRIDKFLRVSISILS